MLSMILAYLLILVFYALEIFVRKSRQARSLARGRFDRGSTILILLSFALVIVITPVLNFIMLGRFSDLAWLAWTGIALMVMGSVLRYWSMRVLGAFYTRTLKMAESQTLVQNGPYRLIRNPGYLGTLLIWIGASLALMNWLVMLFVAVMMLAAYIYRIYQEEAMLMETFGDAYRRYCQHTWRLIPLLF